MSQEYTVEEVLSSFRDISKLIEILSSGYDVNKSINYGSYPPHYLTFLGYAVDRSTYSCIRVLLRFGANPNTPCLRNFTNALPLHLVCRDKDFALAELLLQHGADPNLLENNENSELPLYTACKNRNIPLVKLLLKYKANPKKSDSFGRTCLPLCRYNIDYEILDMLTSYGVEIEKLYEENGNVSEENLKMTEKVKENLHIYRSLFSGIKGGKK